MLSVSRLLNGQIGTEDALRYGRRSGAGPAHLLHYSLDKKPVVVWSTTRRCNLHCGHCYADSHDRDYPGELSGEEAGRMLEDLASFGVPTVLFSGGEPLLRPDLLEMAALASELGMRTVLSTNGTQIGAEKAEELAQAGFSYIGISLDGIGALNDKMRGSRGAFDAALGGIRAARAVGLRTGIRFTVHARNRTHLRAIFELAEAEGVNRLCVYHLAYAGRGERMRGHDLTPVQARETVEEIFDHTEDLGRRGIELEVLTVDNPVDNALLLERVRRNEPARAGDVEQMLLWNGGNQSGVAIAAVDPQGKVHPDQFSWHVEAGDMRRQRFAEIWRDDNPVLAAYRQRPRRLSGRCERCRFAPLCNGGLPVRAESATGDPWAPDPSCYMTDEEIAA
ncbi:MAG: radical SAM protein [Thermoleophilia bacterium]|nr:radical SAM protein [Thermoleophilia bacterium]